MSSKTKVGASDRILDGIIANEKPTEQALLGGRFIVEIIRKGKVIECFEYKNLITDQGLNYIRDVALLDGAQIDPWFFVLLDDDPTVAAGDTYSTQAGWSEVTDYDEATRQEWTGVSGATGVATNAAARAEFTISEGGATVGGAGLVGGGTDADTKGDTAGGGTLLAAKEFDGGDRVLQESDVLRITWQGTFANAA